MLRLRPCFLLIAALLLSHGFAQALTNTLEELVSEKQIIMPADLAAKYPDAEAVYILDEKAIDQSRIINPVFITRHVAIKLLKPSAVEKFRTVDIPLYDDARIVEFEARTLNGASGSAAQDQEMDVRAAGLAGSFRFPLEQGSNVYLLRGTELTDNPGSGDMLKVTDNELLHKKNEEAWKIRRISFQNLQPGSVIEYRYRVEQKRAIIYDRVFFMKEYPALKVKYSAMNNKMMRFSYQVENFAFKPKSVFEPRFNNLENQYNNRTRTALRTTEISDNPETWQFFGHDYFEIDVDTMPAYQADLPFTPPMEDVAPRVDFFATQLIQLWTRSETDYRVRRDPFSPNMSFMIHRMTKDYLVLDREARRAKEEVAKAIVGASTPEEKVTAAVVWARRTFKDNGDLSRWESYFWGSRPQSPDQLLISKVGNADDINHLLVSALQLNGLMVYHAYAKSRDRGVFQPKVFMEAQFDQPLIALEIADRKFRLWQPSSDLPLPADYLDWRLEGVQAFINMSSETSPKVENEIMPTRKADDNLSTLEGALALSADGSAAGKLKHGLTGHFAVEMRRSLLKSGNAAGAEAWLKLLAGHYQQAAAVGQLELGDPALPALEFPVGGELKLTGVARDDGQGLAIMGSIFTDPYSGRLLGKPRELGVNFPHTGTFKVVLEVALPQGYSLPDSLPSPVDLTTRGMSYKLTLSAKDPSTLRMERSFMLDVNNFPLQIWNRRFASMFDQINRADDWKLVLKKS